MISQRSGALPSRLDWAFRREFGAPEITARFYGQTRVDVEKDGGAGFQGERIVGGSKIEGSQSVHSLSKAIAYCQCFGPH